MSRYNQFQIMDNEIGENFSAEVTDQGVYLEHNWMDGGLFIPHDQWSELEDFRNEFLEEIGQKS